MLKPILAALVLLPASALGDIAPPPGAEQAYRRDLIRKAGYSCDDPVTLKAATAEQEQSFRQRGLEPVLAQCGNRKTYLVAVPPRRRPAPDAPRAPEPVVFQVE